MEKIEKDELEAIEEIDAPLDNSLTMEQAQELCKSIRSSMESAQLSAYVLKHYGGWSALGYETWEKLCAAEFGVSQRHVNRMVSAYEIRIDTGETDRAIPESVLRPLTVLPRSERQEAWRKANEVWVDTIPSGYAKSRPKRPLPPARVVQDIARTTLILHDMEEINTQPGPIGPRQAIPPYASASTEELPVCEDALSPYPSGTDASPAATELEIGIPEEENSPIVELIDVEWLGTGLLVTFRAYQLGEMSLLVDVPKRR